MWEVGPPESVTKLVDRLRQQKGITIDHECMDSANHFFTGRTEELIESVSDYVDGRMGVG